MAKLLPRIFLGILAVFLIIQLFRIDKTNPPVRVEEEFMSLTAPPAEIATLLRETCYDCHSHETRYPWYTNVAPVSWWIRSHIDDGRKHFNFSQWGSLAEDRKDHKLEECVEEVKKGEMPLRSYTWVHGEAKLSQAQREQLAGWFQSLRR